MKIYKIYGLWGLCYTYSMNEVQNELQEEVEIELLPGYEEILRDNGMRGIQCPNGYIACMFSGPDPTIYEHLEKKDGRYITFRNK